MDKNSSDYFRPFLIFRGYQAHVVRTGGPLCPFTILSCYFERMGFIYGDSGTTDSNFLFCRTQQLGKGKTR